MAQLEVLVETCSHPLSFVVKRKTTGQQLLNKVAGLLGLNMTHLFGLQFLDRKGTHTWLRASEILGGRRFRKESPLHFRFMVRFWPSDVPAHVTDEQALALLFRQLQAAIGSGELSCPFSTAAQLAAYAAQVQFGDYSDHCRHTHYQDSVQPPTVVGPQEHRCSLTGEAHAAWQMKVACLHRRLTGTSQREALTKYFQLAQGLDGYGVTYFDVTTERGDHVWLGVTAHGVGVYEVKLTPKIWLSWPNMHTINVNGHKFIINRPCHHNRRFVFDTVREQIGADLMTLISGYNRLGISGRQSRPSSSTPSVGETALPSPGQQVSERADGSQRAAASAASEDISSTNSSTPTSSGYGEGQLSRSETMESDEIMAAAVVEEVIEADVQMLQHEEVGGAEGGAEAAGGVEVDCDCDFSQELISVLNERFAVLGSSFGSNSAQSVSDTEEGSTFRGAELPRSDPIYINLPQSGSIDFMALKRSRNRFESSLSLSEPESWGAFIQSLMAPD
ncbi:radixin-like [Amphibalanus amphitrite]|uniref:radixin-like n=1 Tax=Amphibalanus amphitrite TaxID=1232801 RepID=UPI001C903150|nr:radixin-like [Amphibalanus amphitrite]